MGRAGCRPSARTAQTGHSAHIQVCGMCGHTRCCTARAAAGSFPGSWVEDTHASCPCVAYIPSSCCCVCQKPLPVLLWLGLYLSSEQQRVLAAPACVQKNSFLFCPQGLTLFTAGLRREGR